MGAASDAVVWGLEIMLFNFLYYFYNFFGNSIHYVAVVLLWV
jgi:hypothetical protein